MKRIFLSLLFAAGLTTVWATEIALSGKFTINDKGDQVQFAPGNLQYVPSTDTWQFAASQTETVGKDVAVANEIANYAGAIDLFPWGDNYGNHIGEGWRMLTSEEWAYLLREEEIGYGPENAGQATIVDSIATRHGLVILPDDWTTPTGLQDFEVSPNDWTTNRYNDSIWNLMETAGAVFLPCVGETGSYWSATAKDENIAYGIYFYESAIQAGSSAARSSSYAVRLVKDVKETPTDIPTTNDQRPTANKILRNGQIVIIRDNKTYTMIGQ